MKDLYKLYEKKQNIYDIITNKNSTISILPNEILSYILDISKTIKLLCLINNSRYKISFKLNKSDPYRWINCESTKVLFGLTGDYLYFGNGKKIKITSNMKTIINISNRENRFLPHTHTHNILLS